MSRIRAKALGESSQDSRRQVQSVLPRKAIEDHLPMNAQNTLGNRGLLKHLQTKSRGIQAASAIGKRVDTTTPSICDSDVPILQRKCTACSKQAAPCPKCLEEEYLQRKENYHKRRAADSGTGVSLSAVGTHGQPLSSEVRTVYETQLGADFRDVRVHTDSEAAATAQRFSAIAFTNGSNIYFSSGAFSPYTLSGQRLLAHELTHVLQQRMGVNLRGGVNDPHDHYERQADAVSDAVVNDRSPREVLGNLYQNASAATSPSHASQPISSIQRDTQNSDETKEQFAARVRDRAVTRLTENVRVLGQWSEYVSAMDAFQLRAQLLTQTATSFEATAAPTAGGRERYEQWAGTHHTALRQWRQSELDIEATYNERAGNFMSYLTDMSLTGYTTSPSVADRMQVLVGDRQADSFDAPIHVGPDIRYSAYAAPLRRFQTGESGGCQTCHDINLAWQETADHWGSPLPRGDLKNFFPPLRESELLAYLNSDTTSQTHLAAATNANSRLPRDLSVAPTVSGNSNQSSASNAAPLPDLVPNATVPEPVAVPRQRSDLCGEMPDAEDSQRIPSPSAWGPNSAILARAIAKIDSVLTPLGPRGYRVLPRQHFDALYSTPLNRMTEVRDTIVETIAERQTQYTKFQTEIRNREVPYEELCPIVDELLPSTNGFVSLQVRQDVWWSQHREKVLQALELALIALSIMFPPLAVVALPASMALGAVRVSMGVDQRRQARQWQQGTGAGVYSPSQEADAPGLADRGRSNIIWGGLSFGLSAFSLARIVAQFHAQTRLLQQLERGTVEITHKLFPNIIMRAQNGQFMLVDTEAEMILGFGTISKGQLSWTALRVPFPKTTAPSASGTSLVPYNTGSPTIINSSPTSLIPGNYALAPIQSTSPTAVLSASGSRNLTLQTHPLGDKLPFLAQNTSGQLGVRFIATNSSLTSPGQVSRLLGVNKPISNTLLQDSVRSATNQLLISEEVALAEARMNPAGPVITHPVDYLAYIRRYSSAEVQALQLGEKRVVQVAPGVTAFETGPRGGTATITNQWVGAGSTYRTIVRRMDRLGQGSQLTQQEMLEEFENLVRFQTLSRPLQRGSALPDLALLAFAREGIRNPATAVHSVMVLDLMRSGRLTPQQAFDLLESSSGASLPQSMRGANVASRGLDENRFRQLFLRTSRDLESGTELSTSTVITRGAAPRTDIGGVAGRALQVQYQAREVALVREWLKLHEGSLTYQNAIEAREQITNLIIARMREFYRLTDP